MTHVKNWIVYLVFGFGATMLSVALRSAFLEDFLSTGLITLLIALLAINTTTIGLVASKVKDLSDKHGFDFERSVRSMKNSIIEQIVLIVIAVLISVIKDSTVIEAALLYHDIIWTTVLAAISIGAVEVLADTANGIFVVLGQKAT